MESLSPGRIIFSAPWILKADKHAATEKAVACNAELKVGCQPKVHGLYKIFSNGFCTAPVPSAGKVNRVR